MTRALALLGAIFVLLIAGAVGVGIGVYAGRDLWIDGSGHPLTDETDEAGA